MGYLLGCRLNESYENFIEEKGEMVAKGIDNLHSNI